MQMLEMKQKGFGGRGN